MIGISEVIQTIGAMIIFSLLLLTSNRMIQMNTLKEVETEAVGVATTIAQSIIKEAQTKAFDEATANGEIPLNIPDDFSEIKSDSEANRSDFDDFDDYNDYEKNIDTKFGNDSFHVVVNVCYVSEDNDFDECTTAKTVFKKMTVTVIGDYMNSRKDTLKLSYLRRFYKTTD